MHRLWIFAVVLASMMVCFAPVQAEVGVTDNQILFGSFQDMSGPAAYLGKMSTATFAIWKHWVNEIKGGIHGRKIDVVIEDNKYDPVLTKTAFKKLVHQHQVFAIVGVYGSTPCMAIKDDIASEKIPVFPTLAGTQSIFDPPNRYLYSFAINGQDEGILAVDFVVNDLKVKNAKIGIVYQDDEWGKDGLAGIEMGSRKHGLKHTEAPYKRGDKSLSSQVMKLKAAGVTHCFVVAYAPVYAALLDEANKIGWKPAFISTYATVDSKTMEIGGELSDGQYHIFHQTLRHEGGPGWQLMEKLFGANEQTKPLLDVPLSSGYWMPIMYLTQALENAGRDLTREKLVEALDHMKNFDAMGLGKISYAPQVRKGAHQFRILRADFQSKIFVPVTDWREPSLKWGQR